MAICSSPYIIDLRNRGGIYASTVVVIGCVASITLTWIMFAVDTERNHIVTDLRNCDIGYYWNFKNFLTLSITPLAQNREYYWYR